MRPGHWCRPGAGRQDGGVTEETKGMEGNGGNGRQWRKWDGENEWRRMKENGRVEGMERMKGMERMEENGKDDSVKLKTGIKSCDEPTQRSAKSVTK